MRSLLQQPVAMGLGLATLFFTIARPSTAQEQAPAQERSANAADAKPSDPAATIDFSHYHQLKTLTQGHAQYHLWPTQWEPLLRTIEKVPAGGHLLWDTEPWLRSEAAVFRVASRADNLRMFGMYTQTLRRVGPRLKEKKITIYPYLSPVLLQRHFAIVWRGEGDPRYDKWRERQEELLAQAEEAGYLPALREVDGKIAIPLYIPSSWQGKRWTPTAAKQLVENLSGVLDEHNVPHVWLIRADSGGRPLDPPLLKAVVDATEGRRAVWGTENTTGYEELEALILEKAKGEEGE